MSKISHIKSATICNEVYKLYKDILNSYVSDFYLEEHWDTKLPSSWKYFLDKVTITELGELLSYNRSLNKVVLPLSLICIQEISRVFSLQRKQMVNLNTSITKHKEFTKYFWKNVKLKKRHEIEVMSQMCYDTALKMNCFNIVDIGSGLGHLSRMLAYQYGFKVCTFESNQELNKLAVTLDLQLENKILSKKIPHINSKKIVHINKHIKEDISSEELVSLVNESFENYDEDVKFGIVGLHPCGNLGSILLKLYNTCPNVIFINMVSCCYMKLSLEPQTFLGFPLSSFYKNCKFTLDYLSCEIACHAIENYANKLKMKNHISLKIHAFRAALEYSLIKIDNKLKHCMLGNVKYKENMRYLEYCEKALEKLQVKFPESDLKICEEIINNTWEQVVKFYSVRLLLAPIVESIILYDRLLYLEESQSVCDILPAFDCQISPRNHVLFAQKIL